MSKTPLGQVDVPFSALACEPCLGQHSALRETGRPKILFGYTQREGQGEPSFKLDIQRLRWKLMASSRYCVEATLTVKCPSCLALHDLSALIASSVSVL